MLITGLNDQGIPKHFNENVPLFTCKEYLFWMSKKKVRIILMVGFFCTELKEEIGCIGKYYLSVNFLDILGVGASQS